MTFVKIAGFIFIFLALICMSTAYEQLEDGKRMERVMNNGIAIGMYDSDSEYSYFVENYVSMSELFFNLAIINAMFIGLIGICFISIDKRIEELKRNSISNKDIIPPNP